jgi:methylmalonyl-CoA mutase
MLTEAGVAAIFGPGTHIPQAAAEILKLIHRRRKAAE